jgi:hypothetical protein
MAVYTRVDPDMARQGYDEAMRKSHERKASKPTKRALDLDEYLKRIAS